MLIKQNVKKNTLTAVLSVLLAFALTVPAYSGTYTTATAKSGYISVSMTINAEDERTYSPREDIGFTLAVNNLGGQSWLRIKCALSQTGLDKDFTDSCIVPGNCWKKIGEYYYLTVKAERATSYEAISALKAPDAGKADPNANISISVQAEAINSDAIRPDFNSDDPWSGASGDALVNYSSGGSGGGGGGSSSGTLTYGYGLTKYSSPLENASVSQGSWYLIDAENNLWKYGSEASGTYAADGWYYIYNGYSKGGAKNQWFHFDKNAYMETGWVRTANMDWYHLNEISDGDLGAASSGWFDDAQDGKRYYLDKTTGKMCSGWQDIDGSSYYFTALSDVAGPTWVYRLIGNTAAGRWFYDALGLRSYGSMYRNEAAPDGSRLGSDGKKTT
ncbi:MAG: hypothetical protein Q4E57_02080 [Eubacteriales bacterium]|nr:hypothetical protein [Eubacteriales bacterium]